MFVCLKISPETHARIASYAKAGKNLTVDRAAEKIINHWMDETGDFVIDELRKRRARKVMG